MSNDAMSEEALLAQIEMLAGRYMNHCSDDIGVINRYKDQSQRTEAATTKPPTSSSARRPYRRIFCDSHS
jgi:hypothetical protein